MISLIASFATSALAADIFLHPGDDVLTKTASLVAGDHYKFYGGVYEITADLTWSGQGTADEPIEISAVDGEQPIFRMSEGWFLVHIQDAAFIEVLGITFEGADGWEDAGWNAVSIENSSDITFTDNEIRQFDGYGINIGGNSTRLNLTRNWIHDVQSEGIYGGCWDASCFMTDSAIHNNLIHALGFTDLESTNGYGDPVIEYATGIAIAHGGQGNTVRDNVIFDVTGDGIYTGSTEFGPQNILEANAIWDAAGDGIVIEGSALVRNNVIFNVMEDGIQCYDSDRNTLQDVVISFNTVSGAGEYAIQLEEWVGKTGMVLANNAIVNPIGYGLQYTFDEGAGEAADPGNVISTNVVTGFVSGWDAEVHPKGVVPGGGYEDFEDAAAFNFYPVNTGALVNSADPGGETYIPDVDFNGAARQGDVPDVGAYEYGGGPNPGWAIGESFKETGPIAANGGGKLGGCCSKSEDPAAGLILFPVAGLLGWRRRRR